MNCQWITQAALAAVTLGDIAGADGFSLSLVDHRSGRTRRHDYDVAVLPVVA